MQRPLGNFLYVTKMLSGIWIKVCLRVTHFLETVYIQMTLCFTFYLVVNYSFLEIQQEVTGKILHAFFISNVFFSIQPHVA